MAEGRMIVKTISYDARISGLSIMARMLWPYVIAHAETNGSLPRDSRQLRLMCFPDWKDVCDGDVEAAILEWSAARPVMVTEVSNTSGTVRLVLNDFEICNWNLDFLKKRRQRYSLSKTVVDSPGQSKTIPLEVKGSEVKGSEVKKKQQQIRGARPLTHVQILVEAYKKALGVPKDNKQWDRLNFGRATKAAKEILEAFAGDMAKSAAFIESDSKELISNGLTWTLETVARRAVNVKNKPQRASGDWLDDICPKCRVLHPWKKECPMPELVKND